jgi:hypothetical protein
MGRGSRAEAARAAARRRSKNPEQPAERRRYRWSDAELRVALGALVGRLGIEVFPTQREFFAAGEQRLWAAITRRGGSQRWSDELGLALRSQQDRRPYSERAAIADARRVLAQTGAKHLPNAMRLRELGYSKLATRVTETGGARRFEVTHHL